MRVQLPEHLLVAAVTTGLVVSARGVSTREGDFQVQGQIVSFLSGRCVERHLNFLSLAVKHLVLCRGTFPDEGVLKSQTRVLRGMDLILTFRFFRVMCLIGHCRPIPRSSRARTEIAL